MISFCGIDCSDCQAYRGTIDANIELLKKSSDDWGNGKTSPEDWVCLGCRQKKIKLLAKNCSKCPIRKCVIGHGFDLCAQCPDLFKCENMKSFMQDKDSIVYKRNKLIYDSYFSASKDN